MSCTATASTALRHCSVSGSSALHSTPLDATHQHSRSSAVSHRQRGREGEGERREQRFQPAQHSRHRARAVLVVGSRLLGLLSSDFVTFPASPPMMLAADELQIACDRQPLKCSCVRDVQGCGGPRSSCYGAASWPRPSARRRFSSTVTQSPAWLTAQHTVVIKHAASRHAVVLRSDHSPPHPLSTTVRRWRGAQHEVAAMQLHKP